MDHLDGSLTAFFFVVNPVGIKGQTFMGSINGNWNGSMFHYGEPKSILVPWRDVDITYVQKRTKYKTRELNYDFAATILYVMNVCNSYPHTVCHSNSFTRWQNKDNSLQYIWIFLTRNCETKLCYYRRNRWSKFILPPYLWFLLPLTHSGRDNNRPKKEKTHFPSQHSAFIRNVSYWRRLPRKPQKSGNKRSTFKYLVASHGVAMKWGNHSDFTICCNNPTRKEWR